MIKKNMKNLSIFSIFAIFVLFPRDSYPKNIITSTEYDPVFIGEQSEISIGRNTDRQLRRRYRVSDNEDLKQYVNRIGHKLVTHCKRKNLRFKFTVLDDKLVNAFAAPGGFIYITTGIMKMMKNEAELAGVIGHEIGHVVHKHSLKAIQRRMAASLAIQIAAYKMSGRSSVLSQNLVLAASNMGAKMLLLKNSRENELQADSEGVKIMNLAGYNPNAMADLQKMLLKLSKGKRPLAILSTHPPSQERIDVINGMIAKFTNVSQEYNEEEYRKYIGSH